MADTTFETKLGPFLDIYRKIDQKMAAGAEVEIINNNPEKISEEVNRLKKKPWLEQSTEHGAQRRATRQAALLKLEEGLMKSNFAGNVTDLDYVQMLSEEALAKVKGELEAPQRCWLDAAERQGYPKNERDPTSAFSNTKDKSQKRSWMVTLLRIAVEWGVLEKTVLEGIPSGQSADQKRSWIQQVEEGYLFLAKLNINGATLPLSQ